jgi:hypothetical protein
MKTDLASLIDEFGEKLLRKYKDELLPSHQHAIASMKNCRTGASGEILLFCSSCNTHEYKPHSCGHRNCPKCQNHEATAWIERQAEKLLPVPYFLITFTIPASLRKTAWNFQNLVYQAMFKASSQALLELSQDQKYLGGQLGMVGVLHSNSRKLDYHPHVHYLVPAGVVDIKAGIWKIKDRKFLFPHKVLGCLFRGKLVALFKRQGLYVPSSVWDQEWVVDCKAVGFGRSAIKYLSKYLYRGVVSEKLISCQDGKVTFRYQESRSKKMKSRTLPGEDFLWLLLRHVLPKGLRRVRDFGFLHGNAKKTLRLVQLILNARVGTKPDNKSKRPTFKCNCCGGSMIVLAFMVKRREAHRNRSPPVNLNSLTPTINV